MVKRQIIIFIGVFAGMGTLVSAQPAERRFTRQDYIDQWKEEAVHQMLEHGIPASISLAQAILESGDGNSALARYANNHFGIKCHNWDGPGFYIDDDRKNECFRKYRDAKASWDDHSLFLSKRERYRFLFDFKATDYKAWARGLKKAGYATNKQYANLLINLIEKHQLQQLDKGKKMPRVYPQSADHDVPFAQGRHTIKLHDNGIRYVFVKKGDTYFSIAKEFEMNLRQILKYNDLRKTDALKAGQVIYLQPKRGRSRYFRSHTVKKNETMRDISQHYGIKLKQLYRKNNMRIGMEPYEGQKLSLQKQLK